MLVIDGGVIALIIIVFLALVGRSLYLRSTGLSSVKQLRRRVHDQDELIDNIRHTAKLYTAGDVPDMQFADWTLAQCERFRGKHKELS